MKRMLLIGCVWTAAMLAARGAEENFTKAVRAEDFSAAGLAKLSPDELARLDALVRDFKSGALLAARREAAAAEAARVAAEAKAAKVEAEAVKEKEKKSEGGLLAKARVLLKPGTEVDYEATESRIVGNFTGWDGRPIFKLENGQRWQVANASRYYTPAIASPKVKITPAAMGGFWMSIDGVDQRVKVVLVSDGK
jgi:hypothetical protein